MRQKTSVYFDQQQIAKLKRLARRRKRPPAELIREAVDALPDADDDYAVIGSFESDDPGLSEVPKRELLRGFGER